MIKMTGECHHSTGFHWSTAMGLEGDLMRGFERKFISSAEQAVDPKIAGMQAAVRRAQRDNPFVVYEATGNDVVYAIFDIAKTENGVHLEKALGLAGALAGFSCAMVAGLQEESRPTKTTPNRVNRRMEHHFLSGKGSLFSVVKTKALSLGGTGDFDVKSLIARHKTAKTIGEAPAPQMPQGRYLEDTPLDLVVHHWHEILPLLTRYDEHYQGWSTSLSAACAQLIEMGISAMSADEALQIIMEYAAPTSRIGPSPTLQAKTIKAA